MINSLFDTITAISTPPGEGGIAVIRISGKDAFVIVHKIFSKGRNSFERIEIENELSHTIHFGYIFDNDNVIDEVLISIFKKPHSYTGEDVIEISSHGGTFVSAKILELILSTGARHAEPGEFTKRAFLNGRIDLTQAEAVADLINSKTESAHEASIKQLEGSLSEFVQKTRQDIIDITSLVELELDFAEEGLEFIKKEEIKKRILNVCDELEKITESYITGKIIRDGINLVIAGRPNSGKSSLFNYLLKTNRAIVSVIAGTTRDYLEESIIIKGVKFNLIDTAGLRASADEIESEGIKRSHIKISEADLIIYLTDSTIDEPEIKREHDFFKKNYDQDKSVFVLSKKDLKRNTDESGFDEVSILDDKSIEALKSKLIDKIKTTEVKSGSHIILTNLRHKICLENVKDSLQAAAGTIDKGLTGEFISVDLRNAMRFLGEISGEVTNDEILNNIFGKFCIGK